jgi:hypothetical protein
MICLYFSFLETKPIKKKYIGNAEMSEVYRSESLKKGGFFDFFLMFMGFFDYVVFMGF